MAVTVILEEDKSLPLPSQSCNLMGIVPPLFTALVGSYPRQNMVQRLSHLDGANIASQTLRPGGAALIRGTEPPATSEQYDKGTPSTAGLFKAGRSVGVGPPFKA